MSEPQASEPIRLLAAQRLGQIERETEAARPTVDLRAPARASDAQDAVGLHLRYVAASLEELVRTTSSFQELLTGRHLDYSEQVQRLIEASERSLAEHRSTTTDLAVEVRSAITERNDELDSMGAAVSHISRDLAGIIEQVMAAVRNSREANEKSDELGREFLTSFHLAIRHLSEQGQVLRGQVDRLIAAREQTPANQPVYDIRALIDVAMAEFRDELREDLSALRKMLSRPGTTAEAAADWRESLASVRADLTNELASWARELHDDQALMMQQILAGQTEIERLRHDVADMAAAPVPDDGPSTSQLETEMSRLLIELRALRRRPITERVERAAASDRPPRSDRPRVQPVTRPASPARNRAALRLGRPKRA